MTRDRRDEIAQVLRRRLEILRERDAAVSRLNPKARRSQVPFHESWDEARRLAAQWEQTYRGMSPAEAIGGTFVAGRRDLLMTHLEPPLTLCPPSRERAGQAFLYSLWLLPGVREATARRLAAQGLITLSHVLDHPRFGRDARRLCRMLERSDTAGLLAEVATRGGHGHLLALLVAAFHEPSDVLFLDIETMGLFGGSPIILAGFAKAMIEGGRGKVVVWQVVATRPEAEEALLCETMRALSLHSAIVTFNGRAFDYPYLCQRAAYYGLHLGEDPVHFDLLPHARKVFKGRVSDCRLGTLAHEVLGLARRDDVPGSLVPIFYQEYLADPDEKVGLLAAIAAHNRHDMVQMVHLFARLMEEAA